MKNKGLVILAFIIGLAFFPLDAALAQRVAPQNREQISLSFAPLVKKVAPAVVSISSTRTISMPSYRHPFLDDPFFAPFFGQNLPGRGGLSRKRVESALGSGVIVRKDGLVVTNAHVIRGADEVTVILSDGREFPTEVVLSDGPSDLALLRIKSADKEEFPYAPVKASETLEVGDLVIAIGNPFGVGQTVTSGIVSALARPNLNINDYNFFIQTDAAINPGNSGGPLVSMDGNVVGINTAIYSRTGGSLGIGFAIPSEMVKVVLAAEESGQVGDNGIARAWLGLSGQQIDTDLAASLDLKRPAGVLVAELHRESPARKAGLQQGDVITAINNREIRDAAEMKFRWAQVPLGEKAVFTVMRKGKEMKFGVTASLPPDEPARNETRLDGNHPLKGASIANINPAVAFEMGLDVEKGVVVTKVDGRSPASRLVSAGDIIVSLSGKEITDVRQANKILNASGLAIDLVINRKGNVSRIMLR